MNKLLKLAEQQTNLINEYLADGVNHESDLITFHRGVLLGILRCLEDIEPNKYYSYSFDNLEMTHICSYYSVYDENDEERVTYIA